MSQVRFAQLTIISPKLQPKDRSGWSRLYPYYAGYSLLFAEELIRSARLRAGMTVLDPWNGSGTTTLAAARNGVHSYGFDINPVMIVVARARKLRATDCDSVVPILKNILCTADQYKDDDHSLDRLTQRFSRETAQAIRAIERSIHNHLIGNEALSHPFPVEYMSPIAAFFYVCLFGVARDIIRTHRSANPTWLRRASTQNAAELSRDEIQSKFAKAIIESRSALMRGGFGSTDKREAHLYMRDISEGLKSNQMFDFIISSPPYCTRLDYAIATEVELAIMSSFMDVDFEGLRRRMLGSVLSPKNLEGPKDHWGACCIELLQNIKGHPSKSSSGYYYRTHVDYFCKLDCSLHYISKTLNVGATAIFVVQDSYYKNIHNDLPRIFIEMAAHHSLTLRRREDFSVRNIIATKHKHVRRYRANISAIESVLCFERVQ